MKTFIAGLIVVFFGATSPVFAGSLFIEGGPGFSKSLHSDIILLRYDWETSRLFGQRSYYEAVLAHWNYKNRSEAAGLARGVSWNMGNGRYFGTTFGLIGISKETENLGSRWQFYIRFAYEVKIDNRDFSFGLVHFSNGKLFFGWDGPNNGENFITVGVALF